jgi:serine/threonine-protein kinase HipA
VEKIGKQILQQTTYPGFDAIRFFELTLFCYVTGNADMHLKNFSLLTTAQNEIVLSPAYDLLCTKMAIPEDKDEMALTLNGKKRKMIKSDFDSLAKNLKIPQKTVENVYNRFAKKIDEAKSFIDVSFLPEEMKRLYMDILVDLTGKIDLLPPKANDRFSAT